MLIESTRLCGTSFERKNRATGQKSIDMRHFGKKNAIEPGGRRRVVGQMSSYFKLLSGNLFKTDRDLLDSAWKALSIYLDKWCMKNENEARLLENVASISRRVKWSTTRRCRATKESYYALFSAQWNERQGRWGEGEQRENDARCLFSPGGQFYTGRPFSRHFTLRNAHTSRNRRGFTLEIVQLRPSVEINKQIYFIYSALISKIQC